MCFPIVFRRIAKRELDDAISWYESRREGLGQDFSSAVERELERVASSPNQFPRVKSEVRRAVLRQFPYSIYFLVEQLQLVVLAIFHAKRAPEHLENRF